MAVRVLLLQVRNAGDPMADHEVESFSAQSGVDQARMIAHDLLSGVPTLEEVRRYDALMIGGSGEFLVSQRNQPRFDAFGELLRAVVDEGHPTFAACYGFQSLAWALGGEVVHDPDNMELGTVELSLTEEAERDPLFGELPRTFHAQQGHKDRVAKLPPGLSNLAESERCPIQGFRVPDRPIWAVQFHPELDREGNLHRYQRYLDLYATYLSDEERAAQLDSYRDSPEASSLLRRFVEVVLDGT